MAEVVSLADRKLKCDDPDEPHLAGKAVCTKCSHEWEAVAPVGTVVLECPNCKSWWGCFKNAVEPDGSTWTCKCGNKLFWLTPKGVMCRGCGSRSNAWAE